MKNKSLIALLTLVFIPNYVSAKPPSITNLRQQVEELALSVRLLRNELAATREELAAVRANTVLGLDGLVHLMNVDGVGTVVFEGINVQLINGSGISASANGSGNLIIGYNFDATGGANRTGSHNLVLGDDQSYPATEQVVTASVISSRDLALSAADAMQTVVGGDQQSSIGGNQSTTVGGGQTINVGASQAISVGANRSLSIGNDHSEQIAGTWGTTVGKDASLGVATSLAISTGSSATLAFGGDALIDGGDQLLLQTGAAANLMKKNGDILIDGKDINIKASGNVVIKGTKILEN